jgi:hypothetical protein
MLSVKERNNLFLSLFNIYTMVLVGKYNVSLSLKQGFASFLLFLCSIPLIYGIHLLLTYENYSQFCSFGPEENMGVYAKRFASMIILNWSILLTSLTFFTMDPKFLSTKEWKAHSQFATLLLFGAMAVSALPILPMVLFAGKFNFCIIQYDNTRTWIIAVAVPYIPLAVVVSGTMIFFCIFLLFVIVFTLVFCCTLLFIEPLCKACEKVSRWSGPCFSVERKKVPVDLDLKLDVV